MSININSAHKYKKPMLQEQDQRRLGFLALCVKTESMF